ncbi:hypothetical protein DFQ26_001057 [Actinomortierella ambigua]|nr:hypothetical protein DFQ26_001057 [Actinomortierella ambigua]
MLALNAPPGQAPSRQPFVHYRCLCSSPGPSISAQKATLLPLGGGEPLSEGGAAEAPGTPTLKPEKYASSPTITQKEPSTPSQPSLEIMEKQRQQQWLSPSTLSPDNTLQQHHQTTSPQSASGQAEEQRRELTPEEIYASGNNSDSLASLPLSRLYFCDMCEEIRCPKCVQDEIVCYYCPNCLFDVPTASVKAEKHKCSRNCFECPICQSTLSVVADDPLSTQTLIDQQGSSQFHLTCNTCYWNSQEIGMVFDRPNGLAEHVQRGDDKLPDIKEFERLKEHLEKFLRNNSLKPGLPSSTSILSSIQHGTLHSLRYMSSGSQKSQQTDDISHYAPAVQIKEDTEVLEKMMGLTNVNDVTTMNQRLQQLQHQTYFKEQLRPQRIQLRIKKSRRCRSCRHILIKPEQKAQATQYKIHQIALNLLPAITVSSIQPLIVQTTSRVILRFTNPRQEETQITVQYGDGALPRHEVVIHSHRFTVSPFNEVWEYEVGTIAAAPGAQQENVYDRTANSTSIALEVTPVAEGEVKIPLFITFTYKTRKRPSDSAVSDLQTQLVLSSESRQPHAHEYEDKTVSFWSIIGLGEAMPTVSPE